MKAEGIIRFDIYVDMVCTFVTCIAVRKKFL
jgi:hypothetical protein